MRRKEDLTALSSGAVPRKKMTAAEAREFDNAKVQEFNLDSLSPGERKEAREMGAVANVLMMKGLLHRLDPKAHPVPRSETSPEARVAALAKKLDARTFTRLRPRLEIAAREPAKISRAFGSLKDIDLRKPDVTAQLGDIAKIITPGALPKPERMTVRSDAPFNRIDVVLRGLHCVDETNPEDGNDDMILGGILVGASGKTRVMPSFFCGNFNDGNYQSFGDLFLGQMSLNSTSGYPKTFYAIFKLIESDSDDAEVARNLTNTLSFVARIIGTIFAGKSAGSMFGGLVNAIGNTFAGLFDDDHFPPYGVSLTLSNPNQFGGAFSPNLRTGDIRGHGGRYRIGYRYILNA